MFRSIGASSINRNSGHLDTWFSSGDGGIGLSSGIDVGEFLLGATGSSSLNGSNREAGLYGLAWIMAHEFAHQLDAFALMHSQGSLDGRGYGGHYNGTNLLMNGQRFNTATMRPGGNHEILTPTVQERILQYVRH